jgi:hypothetical protein
MSSKNSTATGMVAEPILTMPLPEAICSPSAKVLTAVASDPTLTEDLGLTLLRRNDLPAEVLERLGKNSGVMKSRKVKLAVVQHAKTPRYVSLPIVRHLFTFDLMGVALTPVVPADIKMAAEEVLLHRLEKVTLGERLSLAHRGSGRVAAALLLDSEMRVIHAALDNSRLTEVSVIKALMRRQAPAGFVEAVCHHSRWSPRREVRVALLRNEKTPLARTLEFARSLPGSLVREVLRGSRLPGRTKGYLLKNLPERGGSAARAGS